MSPSKVSSVRIDEDLLRKAKELGLNLSSILREALILKLRECNTGVLHGLRTDVKTNGSLVAYRPVEPGGNPGLGKPGAGVQIPSPALKMAAPKKILERFREVLEVDLNRAESTISGHIKEIDRLLEWMGSDPITKARIREYLKQYTDGPPATFNNVLKSLRVFFREYLDREDLVKGFQFRPENGGPVQVPSKEEVFRFYEVIEDPLTRLFFLILASSGLRRTEALELTAGNISLERRMIIPGKQSRTKRTYITFYSPEADRLLEEYLKGLEEEDRILVHKKDYFSDRFLEASEKSGVKITPQVLREWFCSEMGKLGVPDRYVDGFCGRVPKSVLAQRYTDFSPEKLQEIYEKALLRVLS